MKKNINICQGFSLTAAMLIATMFASCVKFELEAPSPEHGGEITFGTSSVHSISKTQTKSFPESGVKRIIEKDPNDPSSFGLDVMVQDGIESPIQNQIATRGVQLNSINAFDVAAYYHVDVNSESKLYFADTVVDGVNTSEKTHYWPSTGYMNFVATYPTGLIEDGISTLADNSGNLGSFTYTIPTNVIEQQDVMIAVKNNVDNAAKCQDGTPVSLDFHHLFAAVRFKVGKMIATRINSLTISDVQGGTITISYNEDDDSWEYSASNPNASYSPVSTTNGAPNVDTYGLTEGNYITGNDNNLTMFVMPQVLNNAKITINYTELITNTTHTNQATLSGEWIAGKTFTYIINIIADHLQVTLPNPPDADAHYVRVDMDYDLSGFAQYAQGVTISNILATASWLNDGSNTASKDKQSIYLKKSIKNSSGQVTRTELSELQKQGYFTDELWVTEINGKTKVGPKLKESNILGTNTKELDIINKGTLHLFLDENDGDTDRNGQIMITATITANGQVMPNIILGLGNFKQLHPYWNNGIGVERFEDSAIHPYGFNYNRKVVYTNVNGIDHLGGSWLEQGWNNFWSLIFSLLGYTTDTVLPELDDDIANDFINVDRDDDEWGKDIIKTVTIDYGQLSNLKANNKALSQDGLINTQDLYDFTGNVDLAAMEEELNNSLTPNVEPNTDKKDPDTGWKVDITGSNESNPEYYAAYIALTRNKMRELETTIKGSSDIDDQILYQAIMHKENEGNGSNGVNETGAEIIEWFLPSKEDAQKMKEIGTGREDTPISPLNGIYWSSTTGDDPIAETNTAGYAYTFTFNNNAYSTSNTADRNSNHKVRAVRKKPTAN